jgi:hypothetical protein
MRGKLDVDMALVFCGLCGLCDVLLWNELGDGSMLHIFPPEGMDAVASMDWPRICVLLPPTLMDRDVVQHQQWAEELEDGQSV